MGEAKRRGTREERVAKAVERKRIENSNWHRAIAAASNAKTQVMMRTRAQIKKIGVLGALLREGKLHVEEEDTQAKP